jgi:hypothetical protein
MTDSRLTTSLYGSAMSDAAEPPGTGESWMVPRPTERLLELPEPMRCEVTRRHPYYLRLWSLARAHYQSPSADRDRADQEASAALVLRAIGISGDAPPPDTSAAELRDKGALGEAWDLGAVAPFTVRAAAALLLTGAPPDARRQLGQLLVDSAAANLADPVTRYDWLDRLSRLPHPVLKAAPGPEMVSLNLQAPQRTVVRAVGRLVTRLKQQRQIPERRRRDDKLGQYLAAWDLREGWVDDYYDATREVTLAAAGRRLRLSASTAASRLLDRAG